MKAWTVAGRCESVSPCVRASVAASPIRTGLNCIRRYSEGELGQRPALAFHHLEAQNLSDSRRDVQRANRALAADALRHARSKRHEPHPTARLIAAAMVR